MANREKNPNLATTNVPADEDEADILDEVNAEQGDDGETRAFAADVRKAGAVDAATVRENRRQARIAEKKRKGEKVSFNTDDPLRMYTTLLEVWPASAMHVKMKRLSGGPEVTEVITTHPRNPTELFEALKKVHGQCGEASYEIWFLDTSNHEWRGKARITLPDTRPQGQQMTNPYAPMPQGYPPQYAPPPNGTPPVVVHAPPNDMGAMLASFQQMFEMFQRMQPQPAPQAAPQYPPQMPPQPPPGADMATQMAWMRQALDIFQSMQGTVASPARQQPQPQQQQAMQGPTAPAPRGMMWAWMPDMSAFALVPAPNAAPASPMYRTPGGPQRFYPQGGPDETAPGMYGRGVQSQQRQPSSPTEHIREMMGTVRTARAFAEEMGALTGGRNDGFDRHSEPNEPTDPDSPIEVVDTGNGKLVYGRQDGNLRAWDTLLTNLPEMMKWGSKQVNEINKAALERQQREQQLPHGYVRVTEGYEPPPGHVAVPVDRMPPPPQRQDLPPPPANVPPPITTPWDRES